MPKKRKEKIFLIDRREVKYNNDEISNLLYKYRIPFDINYITAHLMVHEDYIDVVLTILDIVIIGQKQKNIDGKRYKLLKLAPTSNDARIIINSWDGSNAGKLTMTEIVSRLLATLFPNNIYITVPHGRNSRPVEDDNFHIFIWSSAKIGSTRDITTPSYMWGNQVDCRDASFAPFGQGKKIKTPEGHVVAELVGKNNLYIFHDLCHYGSSNESKIFEEIILQVCYILAGSKKKFENHLEKYLLDREKFDSQKYARACLGKKDRAIEYQKHLISQCRDEVDDAQKAITQAIRRSQMAEHRLRTLEGKVISPKEIESYRDEYKKLKATKGVSSVVVHDNNIEVETETLYCLNPSDGILYEIGKFKIVIHFSGKVRWFNLDRKVKGHDGNKMQAPHIYEDGHACLGNMDSAFPELIAQCEFAMAIQLAIDFVESVNPSDTAGKYIVHWPQAKKQQEAV